MQTELGGHYDEFKYLSANSGFHVLTLNKTKVDNNVPDQIIYIDDYRIERKNRTSREGGGSHLSQRSSQLYCQIDIVDYGLEFICVEI